MIRWIPFMLVSCGWLVLVVKNWRARNWRRVLWWLGCWGLSALIWTPVAFSFGSESIGKITTSQWGGGVWVLIPLEPASIDTSFWLNVVMTFPQGVLLKWNWPQLRWSQVIGAGLLTGLTLEGGQAIGNAFVALGRWVDINDVLTNWTGVVLGACACALVARYSHWRLTSPKR